MFKIASLFLNIRIYENYSNFLYNFFIVIHLYHGNLKYDDICHHPPLVC